MRIGIFTACYHPTLNGVVISIDTFREDLEKRGHEVFIFAPRTPGYEDKAPSKVFRYPSIRLPGQEYYPIALPIFAPLQSARIPKLGLDIIHTQHLFTMGNLGLKIGRRYGIPVVHTYHTLIAEYTHYVHIFSGLAKRYIIGSSRKYCNSCNQVITPSSEMKKVLRSYGVTAPIQVIPTGVDLDDFKNPFSKKDLKSQWKIPDDKLILLYVSRIGKEKNLDFLLKAIKDIAKKRSDFHLLMVGGGPELENYRQKVKDWDMDSLITFIDMQPKEKTIRIFGACDIFVFPSVTETQGIVIAEAMAAGIPVVAVDKMGPSEIIQNGVDGFLTPLNISVFSDKIVKLLNNKQLRQQMGRFAQENVEKFSTTNSAIKMEEIYERTIDSYSS